MATESLSAVRMVPQADLERLAVLARLGGIQAASPASCFCVELGSRDGVHLIATAARYPGSRFLGIERSARHVAAAERLAEAIGLRNVEFRQDASFGNCDYLVSDGRYSFVTAAEQQRMLEIYASALSPAGVGLIGFDCSPGAHWIRMFRGTMLDHVGAAEGDESMYRAAAELVAMQAEGLNVDQPLLIPIRAFRDKMAEMRPAEFAAQFLSDDYEPASLVSFVGRLREAGLEYLEDAGFERIGASDLRAGVWDQFSNFAAGDRVRMEQYLDFATGRGKRHAVVCRAGAPAGVSLEGLHAMRGHAADHPDKAIAAVQSRLHSHWPASLPLADSMLPPDAAAALYRNGGIQLRATPSPSVRLSSQPRAWPLARYLASHGYAETVTPLHVSLPLNDLRRGLLLLADGSRMRIEIEAAIRGFGTGGDAAAWHRAIQNEFAVLEAAGVFVA